MGFLQDRRRQVALKIEATEGQAETLSASDANINLYEINSSQDIEQHENDSYSEDIGQQPSTAGTKQGSIDFLTDLIPADSNPGINLPPYAAHLLACGREPIAISSVVIDGAAGTFVSGEEVTGPGSFSGIVVNSLNGDGKLYFRNTTNTLSDNDAIIGVDSGATASAAEDLVATAGFAYRPSLSSASATVAMYNDSIRHLITGCRGSWSWSANVGEPVRIKFDFQGGLAATTDTALLTGLNYPQGAPPQLLNTEIDLNGYKKASYDSFEINSGNELDVVKDANGANTTSGILSTNIKSRKPNGKISVLGVNVGDHDYFGKQASNAQGYLTLSVGPNITIHGPRVQYSNISEGERAGYTTFEVDLRFNTLNSQDDLFLIIHA